MNENYFFKVSKIISHWQAVIAEQYRFRQEILEILSGKEYAPFSLHILRSLDPKKVVLRNNTVPKSRIYCVRNIGKKIMFQPKYSLHRNNTISSMFRTPNFFIAEYYGLRNISWGSKDLASGV
jgi:hypothetical protein